MAEHVQSHLAALIVLAHASLQCSCEELQPQCGGMFPLPQTPQPSCMLLKSSIHLSCYSGTPEVKRYSRRCRYTSHARMWRAARFF